MTAATENKNAEISHIALYWDESTEQWQLLSIAESQAEIDDRVKYWRGKGTTNIKVMCCHEENQ